ncbi:zinc finger CCCH domain-containing protein 17-like isoform X1 [Zingiber officinale]|uniref:zinc finger CCCH domain-containing protein 17-like isoform X1 n=1 Tax=Zingiber officinale TaxID=94328 RepID=UPI001C4A854C|nr:zinc finger CCCH domain-containing protein 17-like isoform X1 [Zingiber officinale]
MDFEQPDRYGNRRGYQRAGPSQVPDRSNKVCFHWQVGRCSRHPCPFLHSDPQQTVLADGAAKRGHLQGHMSRNIASAGAPPSKWGKGRAGGKAPDKICNYFLAGNCSFGDKCSFSLLTQLQGHQKVVTGIALPSGSDKLYSCSKDESVRVWDTQTGKCVGAINMGGEVGCMTSEGPWLFIGVVNAVKAWNTQTTTEQGLDGPVGQVYALTVGNGMLYAGTQDARILVWKFSAAGNVFEPATSLSDHRHAVLSLVAGAMKLYSVDISTRPKMEEWVFELCKFKVVSV